MAASRADPAGDPAGGALHELRELALDLRWASSPAAEALRLYDLPEREVVPGFYRDGAGLPRAWLARVRASMTSLAPRFSAERMVREYVEDVYLPAAGRLESREADGCRLGRELLEWHRAISGGWPRIRLGELRVEEGRKAISFAVQRFLGDVPPEAVRVELYADPRAGEPACIHRMEPAAPATGGDGCARYHATVPATRPAADYTPRVVPHHPAALVPAETQLILWQR